MNPSSSTGILEDAVATPIHSAPTASEGNSRRVQEKVMLALILVFFFGVVALTFIPKPFTDVAMVLVVFLTLVALFKVR
jgi:hypothetical protein